MNIPFPIACPINVPAMHFSRWLPITADESIIVREDDLRLEFWFDESSTEWATRIEKEEFSQYTSVPAHRVFADVTIENVPDELANFIIGTDHYRRNRSTLTVEEQQLVYRYRELGEQVHTLTLTYLNRFISYIRCRMGQYWLAEYSINNGSIRDDFLHFDTQVKMNNSTEWVPWRPTIGTHITIELIGESRTIAMDDWEEVKNFIISSRRSPLVGELLSGAEALAKNEHRRSALTEAVTALEVAISEFAQQSEASEAYSSSFSERMDIPSLKNQIEHLGLSGTIRYLFPVIFSEEQVSTDVMKHCQEAISYRQNVVHQGQRDVAKEKLDPFLQAIRQLCSDLECV